MTFAFLFLARISQLPGDGFDEYILLASELDDQGTCRAKADLEGEERLDFVLSLVCLSTGRDKAESLVRDVWSDMNSGHITLSLLSSDRRKMTRPVRGLLRRLGEGGVARIGTAVAFMRDSPEGREDAEAIIEIACLRRSWQFWR